MSTEIIYSHRPAAGISVAATNAEGRLLVAIALTNDGTSRNGVFWKERRDAFSRPKARQILNGRLQALQRKEQQVPMAIAFDTDLDARKFIAEFRRVFKPTASETDTTFTDVESVAGFEFRYRKNAQDIVELLLNSINEVVADASTK